MYNVSYYILFYIYSKIISLTKYKVFFFVIKAVSESSVFQAVYYIQEKSDISQIKTYFIICVGNIGSDQPVHLGNFDQIFRSLLKASLD